jgi:hypothetical protein
VLPAPPQQLLPAPEAKEGQGFKGLREFQVVWQGDTSTDGAATLTPGGPAIARRASDRDAAAAAAMDTTATSSPSPPPLPSDDGMSELRLEASTLAGLIAAIKANTPSSSSPLHLTDEKLRLLTTEAQFRALKPHAVVLVFEGLSPPNPASVKLKAWSTDFDHIPHPSIVTYSQELIMAENEGKPAIAYALAEFIDK